MVTNAKLLSPGCVDVRPFILPQPVERCHTIGGRYHDPQNTRSLHLYQCNRWGEAYFMEKGHRKVYKIIMLLTHCYWCRNNTKTTFLLHWGSHLILPQTSIIHCISKWQPSFDSESWQEIRREISNKTYVFLSFKYFLT